MIWLLLLSGVYKREKLRHELTATYHSNQTGVVRIRSFTDSPLSLKDLTRITIRELLGYACLCVVHRLPLPKVMVQFLLLKDIVISEKHTNLETVVDWALDAYYAVFTRLAQFIYGQSSQVIFVLYCNEQMKYKLRCFDCNFDFSMELYYDLCEKSLNCEMLQYAQELRPESNCAKSQELYCD